MTDTHNTPIGLLADIERRAEAAALRMPVGQEMGNVWRGLGFRVGGTSLVTSMEDIQEILEYPTLYRVPGAKPWLKGVANLHGRLLPVTDLRLLLSGEATTITRETRVIVVRDGELFAGLVVDEVLALQQFPNEQRSADAPPAEPWLAEVIDGGFKAGEDHWALFRTDALVQRADFLNAAA